MITGTAASASIGAQPVEHRHAVEAGELVVEQHDVRRLPRHQRERLLAVAGAGDAVAALAEPLRSSSARVFSDVSATSTRCGDGAAILI